MRFEHTLSPAAAQFFKSGLEQLNAQRLEYLRALGLAKEAEMRSVSLQESLNQQVTAIQQIEGLPAPLSSYQLSPDCTKLIGEIADRPAAAPAIDAQQIEAPAAAAASGRVNGAPGAERG